MTQNSTTNLHIRIPLSLFNIQIRKNFILPIESSADEFLVRAEKHPGETLKTRLIEGEEGGDTFSICRSSPPYVDFSREGRGLERTHETARHGTDGNGGEDLWRIRGGHGLQKLSSSFRVRLQHASGQHATPRSAGCPEGFLPPLTHWTRHLCMSSLV